MTAYQDLPLHHAGDEFSRELQLSVNVAGFESLRMVIRKTWAAPGESDAADNPNVLVRVDLSDGIEQVDADTIRVTIPGSALDLPPRPYVYEVRGVTLLGAIASPVCGLFPIGPHAGMPS